MLEVPAATHQPVRFLGNEYLRVGSYKKKLKDYPEKERRLWGLLQTERFEEGIALFAVPAAELPMLLDVPAFFETLKLATPSTPRRYRSGSSKSDSSYVETMAALTSPISARSRSRAI